MAPERFSGLRGNFGHTQIFSHEKLAAALPEFSPQIPVTESVAENIEWMDKHNLIPDSDADDLEDQIIAAVAIYRVSGKAEVKYATHQISVRFREA